MLETPWWVGGPPDNVSVLFPICEELIKSVISLHCRFTSYAHYQPGWGSSTTLLFYGHKRNFQIPVWLGWPSVLSWQWPLSQHCQNTLIPLKRIFTSLGKDFPSLSKWMNCMKSCSSYLKLCCNHKHLLTWDQCLYANGGLCKYWRNPLLSIFYFGFAHRHSESASLLHCRGYAPSCSSS